MAGLEVKRQMGRGDIAAVSELLDVAKQVDGHAPLGEHKWLDLLDGGREGFAGLVAWEPGHDHPVGYAQLSTSDETRAWALEVVVDPHHRDATPGVAESLVEAALEVIRAEGGGRVQFWVPKPGPHQDSIAAAVGLRRGRELRQLRRPLPLPPAQRATRALAGDREAFTVRPFRPGLDDDAWLDVNNRAFRGHDEQGGWDLEMLRKRQEQPWFDPAGLLLHEREGRLAGFCWTKVHTDEEPALGEIYVVAVDPELQGHGLGRALTVAGLDHLASRALHVAMLYVDADNEPALRLYDALGFELDHIDRAYVGTI